MNVKACTITSTLAAMLVCLMPQTVFVKCSELRNGDPADRTATRAGRPGEQRLMWIPFVAMGSGYFFYTAVLWMAIGMSFGLLAATFLIFPDLVKQIPVLEYFTFRRVRPVHTNLVMFSWLSDAYIGALYYMVPRLAETQLYSERLDNFTVLLHNLLMTSYTVLLLFGQNQGREYARHLLVYHLRDDLRCAAPSDGPRNLGAEADGVALLAVAGRLYPVLRLADDRRCDGPDRPVPLHL